MIECISYFFGGAVFANSIPHLVNGSSGRAFPTPFAQPRGRGESSALLNVWWAAFNLIVAYGLLVQVGEFNLRTASHVGAAALGGLLMALFLAWRFGPIYAGNKPKTPVSPDH